jgi:hypothetical protein
MRGKPQAQPEFLTTINPNQRVPADHPLRGTKTRVTRCWRNYRRCLMSCVPVRDGLALGMEQPDGGVPVTGAEAFPFAGQIVLDVAASDVFLAMGSVSLFHNCF